jgi:hypothetical protein
LTSVSAEHRVQQRRIAVIGQSVGLQGDDGILALDVAIDLDPETIASAVELLGYSPQAAERFTQSLIDAEVLWDDTAPPEVADAPPADDRDEDEAIPGMSTETPSFDATMREL